MDGSIMATDIEQAAIAIVSKILAAPDKDMKFDFESPEVAKAVYKRVTELLDGSPFEVVASANWYGVKGTNGPESGK
jgi:hypothetical protein